MHLVVAPLAIVLRAVGPTEGASPMLLALQVVPIEVGPIRPRLATAALLLVLVPLTLVGGALSVVVVPDAVRLVVDPLALEDVAVCENESTVAIGHIILPETLKLAAIGPDLQSIALLGVILLVPLAGVDLIVIQLLPILESQTRLVTAFCDLPNLIFVQLDRAKLLLLQYHFLDLGPRNSREILLTDLVRPLGLNKSDEFHLLVCAPRQVTSYK